MSRVRETDGPVADAVQAMYAAFPDAARFDAHLQPDITIWESDRPGPVFGLPELTALRGDRRGDQPTDVPTLSVHELLVDRWGDTAAVARYVLRATGPAGDQEFRVTDVWEPVGEPGDGGWRIVHHHAEQRVEGDSSDVG